MMLTTNTISATLNKTISMLSMTMTLYLLAFRFPMSEVLGSSPRPLAAMTAVDQMPLAFSDPPGKGYLLLNLLLGLVAALSVICSLLLVNVPAARRPIGVLRSGP